jgi:hypothetical protein
MSKKKLARGIGVCTIAIMIIVAITILPACESQTPPTYGLEFDGIDDYVNCGNNSRALNITDAITIEAWGKDVGNFGWSNIAGRKHSTKWQMDYGLAVRNDGANQMYSFIITDSDGNKWDTGVYSADIDSEWHHAAGTFDGSYLKLCIDGELKKIKDIGFERIIATSGYDLIMGDYFDQALNATISNIRIWGIARTESQIKDNMSGELTGDEEGLVGYWKLNEGSGTVANDSTANNNHGTLYGDLIWYTGGG